MSNNNETQIILIGITFNVDQSIYKISHFLIFFFFGPDTRHFTHVSDVF